jgi:hypothetical protein
MVARSRGVTASEKKSTNRKTAAIRQTKEGFPTARSAGLVSGFFHPLLPSSPAVRGVFQICGKRKKPKAASAKARKYSRPTRFCFKDNKRNLPNGDGRIAFLVCLPKKRPAPQHESKYRIFMIFS